MREQDSRVKGLLEKEHRESSSMRTLETPQKKEDSNHERSKHIVVISCLSAPGKYRHRGFQCGDWHLGYGSRVGDARRSAIHRYPPPRLGPGLSAHRYRPGLWGWPQRAIDRSRLERTGRACPSRDKSATHGRQLGYDPWGDQYPREVSGALPHRTLRDELAQSPGRLCGCLSTAYLVSQLEP